MGRTNVSIGATTCGPFDCLIIITVPLQKLSLLGSLPVPVESERRYGTIGRKLNTSTFLGPKSIWFAVSMKLFGMQTSYRSTSFIVLSYLEGGCHC